MDESEGKKRTICRYLGTIKLARFDVKYAIAF